VIRMAVDEEVHERADESRTLAAVRHEPRAADLRTALEVEQSHCRADLPVRLHAGTLARRAPVPEDDVVLLTPVGDVGERDVRQLVENCRELPVRLRDLTLETRDFFAERLSCRDQIGGVFACLLPPSDILRARVARCLALFDGLQKQSPFLVQPNGPIDQRPEGAERAASPHRRSYIVGPLTY